MSAKTTAGKSRKKHRNDERTVKCPVEGCDETPLARGVHLHVLRSKGDGHGEQNEVPKGITFDSLETVGSREVEMDYPETRESEGVSRLCPYCERPFRGGSGVMIHLGQVAGKRDHPKDAPKRHEPSDFAIAKVDDHENVVEVVEPGSSMPSTQRRLSEDAAEVDGETVEKYVEELRRDGLTDAADKAERVLLGSQAD